jgi:hypothetical protein
MGTCIESIVVTGFVHEDVSVRRFIAHAFASQLAASEGFQMTDLFSNSHVPEQALRMLSGLRQDEKDIVSRISFPTEVIPADAPSGRVCPKMGVVVDPAFPSPTRAATHSVKRTGYVHQSFHSNG